MKKRSFLFIFIWSITFFLWNCASPPSSSLPPTMAEVTASTIPPSATIVPHTLITTPTGHPAPALTKTDLSNPEDTATTTPMLSSTFEPPDLDITFIQVNTNEFVEEYELEQRIPILSVLLPAAWEHDWFSDSGAICMLVAPHDLDVVWHVKDHTIPYLVICPFPYTEGELSDLFVFAYDREEGLPEMIRMEIYGREAAQRESVEFRGVEGMDCLETVILGGGWVINVAGFFQGKDDLEIRPIIEQVIRSIRYEDASR
jgi:hypothetical protein